LNNDPNSRKELPYGCFYADMKIFFDVSVALLAVIWYNKKAEAKNLFCSQKSFFRTFGGIDMRSFF